MSVPLTNASASITWTLRYLEWIFIAVHVFIRISDGSFSLVPEHSFKVFAFYGAFAVLSWIFPLDRPRWQKQGYIFLGMLLAISANSMGIATDLLLYLYIAKSCFLLNRKSMVFAVASAGIAWVYSEILLMNASIQLNQALDFQPYGTWNGSYDLRMIALPLGVYVGSSAFVISFSFVVISEQKSRQRAEALAEQVESLAVTLERTRIARDIHDSLGHTLTNLDIQLEVAQKLRQRSPEQALQALDTAKMLSSQCIEEVGRSLQTMRQSDFDLNHSLRMLVEQIRQASSVRVQGEISLPKLSLQTSHQIYSIVKEGLFNIQKHARASQICLQSYATSTDIVLELKDNGIGFAPQSASSGHGLKGMAKRVQTLGGQLKIDSALGQGTQIRVILPR